MAVSILHGFSALAGENCVPFGLVFASDATPRIHGEVLYADRYGRCYVLHPQSAEFITRGEAMAYSDVPDKALEPLLRLPVAPVWRVAQEKAGKHIDQWRQVTGTVTQEYQSKQMLYLNFGEDWKTDFTIAVPKKHIRAFRKQFPDNLAGASVAVRGYVESYYGPRIVLLNPQMMKVNAYAQ